MASYSAPVAQDPGHRWESITSNACPLPGWCCGMMMWKNPAPTTLILLANSKAAGAWWGTSCDVLLLAARWKARGGQGTKVEAAIHLGFWAGHRGKDPSHSHAPPPYSLVCAAYSASIYLSPLEPSHHSPQRTPWWIQHILFSLFSLSLHSVIWKKNWTQACCYKPDKGVKIIINTVIYIWSLKLQAVHAKTSSYIKIASVHKPTKSTLALHQEKKDERKG